MSVWIDMSKKKPRDGEQVIVYQPLFTGIDQEPFTVGTYSARKRMVIPMMAADHFGVKDWWMALPLPPPRKKKPRKLV